jgi:hypothetical protein
MTRPPHDVDTPPAAPVAPLPAESAAPSEVERARAERAIRLASALRANLRRRKAPARTVPIAKDSN